MKIQSALDYQPSEQDSWQRDAQCAEASPEIFFPRRGDSEEAKDTAKEYCGMCSVRIQCLAYAMATEQDDRRYGIYGGKTAAERKKIHKLMQTLKEKES